MEPSGLDFSRFVIRYAFFSGHVRSNIVIK